MNQYLSPAKLNLFLRITGRRDDGYHNLQSLFVKIDLYDTIELSLRNDGIISRQINIDDIDYDEDLNIKAAQLMKSYSSNKNDKNYGVDIKINKAIPMRAGLGGGSSNAATILSALNKLWDINLDKYKLAELGLGLGADVPFFLHEKNCAWIEGIGEDIQEINLDKFYYILVKPNVHASTKQIFTSDILIRNNPVLDKNNFIFNMNNIYKTGNTLEPVVTNIYPQILDWLAFQKRQGLNFRMTGSGSCFFCMFNDKLARDNNVSKINIPDNWKIYACENI